jgi:hypothetical protein
MVSIEFHGAPCIRNREGVLEVCESINSAPDFRAAAHRAQTLIKLAQETRVAPMVSSRAR